MVNAKIRLISFFVAKDGEGIYNQQKEDQDLNVALITASYSKIRLKQRKRGKPLGHSDLM